MPRRHLPMMAEAWLIGTKIGCSSLMVKCSCFRLILGRAARGIAPAPSEVSCRVCASGRRWLGYFCDLRPQNLPRKPRIAWVWGTTSLAASVRAQAIFLDLPDSIYVHAAAYIP